jgi:hypothetical protein
MSFVPYEIDEDLTVKVYLQGLEGPWIMQSNHPDDRDWADRNEAVQFAEEYSSVAAEVYAQQQIAATTTEENVSE